MDPARVVEVITQPLGTITVHASAAALSISVDMHVYSVTASILCHSNGSWNEHAGSRSAAHTHHDLWTLGFTVLALNSSFFAAFAPRCKNYSN